MDVLTPEQRQKNMRAIRGRGTKLERLLGRELHARGFRHRLNVARLPGTPDLVFAKYRGVIFAHGCFWHGHDCDLFKVPATRKDFWVEKIDANKARDQRDIARLQSEGWRVLIVWECALRGRGKSSLETVGDQCAAFLCSEIPNEEIRGTTEG
jgi:DNA mismatch endonuclease (patch repair protein)